MEWSKCGTNVRKTVVILMIALIKLSVGGLRDDLPEDFSWLALPGSSAETAIRIHPSPALFLIPVQRDLLDYYTNISANVCTVHHPTNISYLWTYCATGRCGLVKYSRIGTLQLSPVTKLIDFFKHGGNCSLDLLPANETGLEILDENLYHLNLKENDIAEFPPGYFCILTKLKNLYLSRISVTETTKLGFLPSALCQKYTGCCLCRLKNLDLQENSISVVRKDSFCGMEELVRLNMTSCKVRTIEDGAFAPLYNLQTLLLSGNLLTILDGHAFTSLRNLVNLDLSKNKIEKLRTSTFMYLNNLEILQLNDNRISSLMDRLFANQKMLHMLDLSDNRISNLSDIVFASLKNLKTLYLANNRLKVIPYDTFLSLTSIEELTVNDNYLTNFPVWKLSNLTNLKQLGIHRNRWSCECDYVKRFRSFLQDHSNILLDSKQLFCFNVNNVSMPLINFDLAYCYVNSSQLIVDYSNYASVWGPLLAVSIFLTVISVLVFIYRHKMKILIYSRCRSRLISGSA